MQATLASTQEKIAAETEGEPTEKQARAAVLSQDAEALRSELEKSDEYVKIFAEFMLRKFENAWDDLFAVLRQWSTEPTKTEQLAREVAQKAEAEQKSWWTKLKEGAKKAFTFVYEKTRSFVHAVGKIGFRMARLLASNPFIARIALILGNLIRKYLCGRLSYYFYEYVAPYLPFDVGTTSTEAEEPVGFGKLTGQLVGVAAEGTLHAALRSPQQAAQVLHQVLDTALDSMGFNKLIEYVKQITGDSVSTLFSWIPYVGGLIASATKSLSNLLWLVLDSNVRTVLHNMVYANSVLSGFPLLWEFLNPMTCLRRTATDARQMQDVASEMLKKDGVLPPVLAVARQEIAPPPTAAEEEAAQLAAKRRERRMTAKPDQATREIRQLFESRRDQRALENEAKELKRELTILLEKGSQVSDAERARNLAISSRLFELQKQGINVSGGSGRSRDRSMFCTVQNVSRRLRRLHSVLGRKNRL